ncbi:hypothetical protein [Streptomyces sp. NRRL S-646]|uniref:hypothetical protein n=1 Tax=Streptomyces sp. NRRL S-646 TaxID=1463917 RepID=UPI0004C549F6|nr:hypothetical protein [Streptomyces sp. NRRL S-646]
MAEVEELLDEVSVRMPSAAQLRAQGDRRLARRRSAAVAAVVVAVAGAVSLAVLPGNGTHKTRPAKPPTASHSAAVGNTPYEKNGTVNLKAPKSLPLYGQWHWRASKFESKVGGCSAVDLVLYQASGWSYDMYYRGDRGAKANHRYTEFDGPSDRSTTLSGLREALSGCGLTSQGASTGPEGQTLDTYTGTIDHRQARIVVEYGDRWLSVVKESGGTQGN